MWLYGLTLSVPGSNHLLSCQFPCWFLVVFPSQRLAHFWSNCSLMTSSLMILQDLNHLVAKSSSMATSFQIGSPAFLLHNLKRLFCDITFSSFCVCSFLKYRSQRAQSYTRCAYMILHHMHYDNILMKQCCYFSLLHTYFLLHSAEMT